MWKHGFKYQLCRKLYKKDKLWLCMLISPKSFKKLIGEEVQDGYDEMIEHMGELWVYYQNNSELDSADVQVAHRAFLDKYVWGIQSPSLLFAKGERFKWDWMLKQGEKKEGLK